CSLLIFILFFFQAEDGIRDRNVTGVQTCALPIWPEEFLFRGLLQNILARATKSDLTGWWIASIVFGLSHITNMGFPNWRYVILRSEERRVGKECRYRGARCD